MEIIYAPAENIYPKRNLPENLDPKKEIPVLIDFKLEDLTPKKGYTVTDVDGLFRRLVGKLNISFHNASLRLPRSGDPLNLFGGSEPLAFYAERGNELHCREEEKLKPYAGYNRRLFRGNIVFNDLDRGKATLDDVLKYVRDKPVGEDLIVGLENARLSLHTGYDYAASLCQGFVQHERELENVQTNIINVQLNTPWLSKFGAPAIEKKYTKESPKEIVEIFESLIDSYFSYIRYRIYP